ncbi:MAG TPA: Npt1/Npt2 family nucleotide transporter [Longimicrobiales bacterium]|nr:Npt1/Npt2 family nucleotide transporter [Longimicrobiales bacterium]
MWHLSDRLSRDRDLPRLLALMTLFFVVVCAVGILRPIKNALALDGLGATDFYKVYLVSAVVVLFVPIFNQLAKRLPWRTLFAAVAMFFAANLVLFRLLYEPGSAAFGLAFYGWYDLFAAALVTQFFMATQFYFNARSAKRAYPLVIAGGSIGATLGGAITGFFAESVGTPNLLLVAAALIAVFAVAIPWVLDAGVHKVGPPEPSLNEQRHKVDPGGLRRLAADRQVRLIAVTVLMTIVVKQLVDYQFNVVTKEVFETRDAVSAFQGKFNAATQWLPLIVLAGLRPALRRWGIGVAVLLLPVFMFATTAALAVAFGLWAAVAAKGAETSLRYSAERAGREMLYVPVRDDLKLQAKAYIDVAVEKGVGKMLSAVLIMLLLMVMNYRQVAWVSAGLALVWLALALAVRREYVRTLANSIEGRFASYRGVFASLVDGSSLPVIRRALSDGSPLRTCFALELLAQADASELRALAGDLNDLLEHEHGDVRATALAQLARVPELADRDRVQRLLLDDAEPVREAAVRVLLAAAGDGAPALLNELLHDDASDVRTAALRCATGSSSIPVLRVVGREYLEEGWRDMPEAPPERRAELALATAGLDEESDVARYLPAFLADDDARVRSVALRSAAVLGRVDCCDQMIGALGHPGTRDAARDALATIGEPAIPSLTAALMDECAPAAVRRAIPSTMVRIPGQQTVAAMLELVLAPQTDQLLDFRTLKALSKIRARHPEIEFDPMLVMGLAQREADHAARYRAVLAGLPAESARTPLQALLATSLGDGFRERQEGVFRCLGLLHAPDGVFRAHAAVAGGLTRQQANALEWLEETIGAAAMQRLAAVLDPGASLPPCPITDLLDDGDSWIACLARSCTTNERNGMELIEKVFLLQQVDLLRGARGAHVALLASIAEEVTVPADTVLIRSGEAPTAMYVVTSGAVELNGVGERLRVEAEGAFGTWALIDQHPSPIEARTLETTKLLRVTRTDFHDLLADHSELALGLLQGLARRVRSLVA